jgi:hypothetical protein
MPAACARVWRTQEASGRRACTQEASTAPTAQVLSSKRRLRDTVPVSTAPTAQEA